MALWLSDGTANRPVTELTLGEDGADSLAESAHLRTSGVWFLVFGHSLFVSGEYITHLSISIERPDGEGGTFMQSYTSFEGLNWIKSLRIQPASVDQPIGSGSLVLHRQVGDLSLAPLVTQSILNQDGEGNYIPALDFGREIEIVVGITAPGDTPDVGDLELLFQGVTDDIQWPGKSGDITVPFRDRSGPLADTVVRTGTVYGSEAGVDAVEVMQQILDNEMGVGEYVLDDLVPVDSPRFLVKHYEPRDIFVFQALQAVADQWGGKSVRQERNDAESEFRIAVLEPNREATAVDYEISQSTYIETHQIATEGKNRRTIVRGTAIDRATGALLVSQIPEEADVPTDPLVAVYGPRLLSFGEEASSLIDTQDELDAMVAPIYADVSTPAIPLEMETKLAPFARVDDMVRWGANTIIFDNFLDGAVTGLTHEFPTPGVGRTRWRCTSKPTAGILRWLRLAGQVAGLNATARISVDPKVSYTDAIAHVTLTASETTTGIYYRVRRAGVWGAPALLVPSDGLTVTADIDTSTDERVAVEAWALDATGKPGQVAPFDLDQYTGRPALLLVEWNQPTLRVIADPQFTRSLLAYRTDVAGWTAASDGYTADFTPPIGVGATWPLSVCALAEPAADVDVNTLRDCRPIVISDATAPAEPTWIVATATAPSVGDDVVTATLDASATPGGYTARLQIRYRINSGSPSSYVNITASTTPAVTLSTTQTAHTYATPYERTAAPAPGLEHFFRQVTAEFLAEILNGSSVVVATETPVATWWTPL